MRFVLSSPGFSFWKARAITVQNRSDSAIRLHLRQPQTINRSSIGAPMSRSCETRIMLGLAPRNRARCPGIGSASV
jgi:hypothetical protein